MRRGFLILLIVIALLSVSCQSETMPVSDVPTPAAVTSEERSVALAALTEQRVLFEQEVAALLEQRLAAYRRRGGQGDVGIYFLELRSGFSTGQQAAKLLRLQTGEDIGYFNTASVAKLPMAFVVYTLADQGRIDLEQPYFDAVTGRSWRLRPLIHRMLTHSVNDYYNILLRMIGPQLAQQTLTAAGMPDTRLSRELLPAAGSSNAASLARYGTLLAPRTTPTDLGLLLAELYRGMLLTATNAEEMLDALLHTEYNSRIPAGIGYASPVAHKTGTSPDDGVYNDAALVLLPDNPFVLVILSKDVSSYFTRTMCDLAGDLYAYERARADDGVVAVVEAALALAATEVEPLPVLISPDLAHPYADMFLMDPTLKLQE